MKKLTTTYSLAILMLMAVCNQAFAQDTSDLLTVRDALDKALNAHDFDTLVSYFTDDAVFDFVPDPVLMNGKAEIKAFFDDLLVSFPDFSTTEGRVLVSGNVIVVDHSIVATHGGEWQGIPPTGNSVVIPHLDIYEFEGDKIKKLTSYTDMAAIMIQVGAVAAPDMPDFVPSFTLSDPEPTGLAPLEANTAVIEGWNSHDMVNYAKMLHKDFNMFAGPVGIQMNRDQWIAMSEMYFQIFTGAHIDIVRVIDMGGGWVLTEEISGGVHDGPFFGVPPTGRNARVRAVLLGHFDSDGLLTEMSYYFDNMTIIAQLTAEEWPLDGSWIKSVPTPLGNIIITGVYTAQDAAKTRYSVDLKYINALPLLLDLYPDVEQTWFAGGQVVKIGLNKYEGTFLEYDTKTSGPGQTDIVGIGIVSATFEIVGPDMIQGQGMGSYYMAAQDADHDGFPDAGEEPVLCLPWGWTGKRLAVMPPCVPPPMP